MDIHEYQAKEILGEFGVKVPRGGLAYSPEQAAYRAREVGGNRWVVKAQIHSGGRHKLGGVVLCDSENDVYNATEELLGRRLGDPKNGKGKVVFRVYVEAFISVAQEFYIGFVLNRTLERIMVVASKSGGVEVQEIAERDPDSIIRTVVEPAVGMQAFQARQIAFRLGVEPRQVNEVVETILGCYQAFEQLDATMVEINPLVVTDDAGIFALDAKMTFDDNALFRRPEIAELRDKSQEDPLVARAADRGLTYVGLDGDIACIVNGGGLAMATIDSIELAGGKAASFLDIGGGASAERVAKAFRLVAGSENTRAVLVNVFSGINRCDWIAQGIIQAFEKDPIDVPLIVRLAGTKVDEGRKLLAKSGLPLIRANTLAEAAQRAVTATQSKHGKQGAKSTASGIRETGV